MESATIRWIFVKRELMMKSGVSWSAGMVTLFRAIENLRPENKRICTDPMAVLFLERSKQLVVKRRVPREFARFLIKIGLHGAAYNTVVARTAYIDSVVREYMRRGIRELVILGAGFDTRAYRLISPFDGIRVFEIDHPDMQEAKKKTIISALGSIPRHVTFVSVDFERESLEQRLIENGFYWGSKVLFILEGVMPYLSNSAIDSIFGCIRANSTEENAIVFTYSCKPFDRGIEYKATIVERFLSRLFEKKGEPRIHWLGENQIEFFCEERGFLLLENLYSEELVRRYFRDSKRARHFNRKWGIALAVCKGQREQTDN